VKYINIKYVEKGRNLKKIFTVKVNSATRVAVLAILKSTKTVVL
jgi:hypothetical protein